MSPGDIQVLLEIRPESYVLFLIVMLFRPLGLMYGFTLFSWGLGANLMIRIALSFALGMLVFWNQSDLFVTIADTKSIREIVFILMIEFALGFGVGGMASAPFHALKYAGAITDTYRGENNSGLEDPSGGTLSTFSVLYFITGSVVFCQSGGFYVMVNNLYSTYMIWPIGSESIAFKSDGWLLGVQLIQRSLLTGIAVAAPLLIIFLSIDFILAVAAKLAPRFNIYENSFLFKNIAAIVSLPVLAFYLLRISDSNMGYAYNAVISVEAFLE